MLSDAQIERYSRQILLPDVGGRGQERLLRSRAALLGTGRLGHLVGAYLAGAGVGQLAWQPGADDDPRAAAALVADLAARNPDTVCHWRGGTDLIGGAAPDVLIAASADRRDMERANGAALARDIPLVAGSAGGTAGWVGVFAGARRDRACLGCAEVPVRTGVLTPVDLALEPAVTGVIASLLAVEGLRRLLGLGRTPVGALWRYDGRTATLEPQPVAKRPGCEACDH